jgi:hypothetical protein
MIMKFLFQLIQAWIELGANEENQEKAVAVRDN